MEATLGHNLHHDNLDVPHPYRSSASTHTHNNLQQPSAPPQSTASVTVKTSPVLPSGPRIDLDDEGTSPSLDADVIERMKAGIQLRRSPSPDRLDLDSHRRDLADYDAKILEELHRQVVASAKSVISAQEGRPQGATPTFWHQN